MDNYIKYKITYMFHRLGFYYYSVKYYIIDNCKNKSLISKIINYPLIFFKSIFKMSKIFNYKYGYYEYLEIPITTKCSLRCAGCSNLIPCYKQPYDLDRDILLKSIDNFLEIINNIVYIRILGGEPFISNNLIDILKKLLLSNKIQRIEIVTNGTIIPKDKELLNILNNPKIIVSISKYPNVNIEKLIDKFKQYNITYHIDKISFWLDYGVLEKKNKTKKELFKQYKNCDHVCKSMLNGEIHLCPRSSHGKDLGIIPVKEEDYLNILDDNLTIVDKKNKLNKLLRKKCILACDYCDFATKKVKKIEVAKQLKKD